tara:strand:- start:6020 stop:6601 length:582 start_codon:yes stop_codon:yes gene_type:complete
MKPLSLLVIIFFITINISSQERKKEIQSISEQFDEIYKVSYNYKENKVIKKVLFENLKENTLDSIRYISKILQSKNKRNNFLKDSLKIIKKELINLKSDIKSIKKETNLISLFGIKLSKIIYKLIVWITVLLLIFLLTYSFFEYKHSFIITSEAKKSLKEVENELSDFRKNSLVREQKLRRLLQDEINKQRGV